MRSELSRDESKADRVVVEVALVEELRRRPQVGEDGVAFAAIAVAGCSRGGDAAGVAATCYRRLAYCGYTQRKPTQGRRSSG